MNEWDINTEAGWSAKLRELLEEADRVGESLEERRALSQRFVQFIVHSHPHTETIKSLDRIADAARRNVLLGSIDERVAAIGERTLALVLLTERLEETTVEAQAAAASIRGEEARSALESLTLSVSQVKALAESLRGGEDRERLTRLQAALERLIVVQQEVEAISDPD